MVGPTLIPVSLGALAVQLLSLFFLAFLASWRLISGSRKEKAGLRPALNLSLGASYAAFAAASFLDPFFAPSLLSFAASAPPSGRSISSTNAIGALSPLRKPDLRMRR